jgi:hypothetical protein
MVASFRGGVARVDRIYIKPVRIRVLGTWLERGIFAIPELQREFVWNARKACDLLDSIYRRYPIGTLLVWKTDRRNEVQLRKRLHILPPYNPSNSHIYFLIDGQQRLSVLWHLVRGQPQVVVNSDGKEVDFGAIYFDPHAADGDRRFLYRRRAIGDLGRRVVRVTDLLSPRWHNPVGRRGKRARRRIEQCRRIIRDYKTLIVFCETKQLPEVRETFIRINSLGMRIGAADRAFARASRLDMRGHVRDVLARLKYGFDGVKRTTVLQTIALALGHRDLGERAIDAMIRRLEGKEAERRRFERAWPHLREAFGRAVDFAVSEIGVPSFDFLPSEPMVTILTLFFYHNGNVRPSRAAKRRLRQWFWSTAVGARYTGRGYRPNLLADALFVERLAGSPKAQGNYTVRVPSHVLRTTDYRLPGPLSNAFLCLLRLHTPCYLEDGSEVPRGEISSRSNRRDKHHVFPRALLAKHGIGPNRYNSILNICYLVARENQSVGHRAPRHYLMDVPRNGYARRAAMRSHLIPSREGQGVWDRAVKRGFKTFLDDRGRMVIRALERQAGQRLFERD